MTGRIALGAFYARRAARLVPALGALLLVVGVGLALVGPSPARTATLWGVVGTLTYSSNWLHAFLPVLPDGDALGALAHHLVPGD